MSEFYFSSVGQQSCRNNWDHQLITDESSYSDCWLPRAPTRWTIQLQNELLAFFQKVDYPFRYVTAIPFMEPLRSEIRRFFLSLDAYIESPNPVIPYKEILYGSTDKDYAETLKRIKRKSFETTWRVEHFALPDWWNDIPSYRIKDIGDIFNYSYLIFFEEDSDDYLWGNVPLEGKFEKLALFKECVRDLLPERNSFNKIDEIEVLASLSSSSSYDPKQRKSVPHYKIKNKHLFLPKRRGVCKRSRIRVSPNNCRDSVLNSPSDLNVISLIDHQLMEILKVVPGHIHLQNKEIVDRRYQHLFKNNNYFLHRDLRKEGITKPRILLKAMLEALHEEYPDILVFQNTSFYDDFILLDNDNIISPKRGHGLGMANTLTTLMQLAVHEMILDELRDDIPDMNGEVLCINDDMTIGFIEERLLEAYWDKEDEIMSDLSLLREPTKSFYSYGCFVLAERYLTQNGEYAKTSYQLRELLLPMACANITHAKEYFSSVQTYVNTKFVPKYIEEIYNYWGYEFFPNEFMYPTKVGGWINEKVNSVDMSLLILESLKYNNLIVRGFYASKVKLHERTGGEIFTPPIVTLLGHPVIPERYNKVINKIPENALNDKFGKSLRLSNSVFKQYWTNLYRARQKEFKKPYDVSYEDLIKKIVSHYETIQFYPNELMTYKFHPCNMYSGQVSDPYLDPNPIMAMTSKFNETTYPFKEEFSISFTDVDNSTKKVSSLFSKEIQRSLKSDTIAALMTGKYHEIYYPSDHYRPEEQYLNPIKIGEVTAILNWGKGFPEVREDFISPIINKKREIYNRLFSLSELFIISRSGISRERLKSLCDYLDNNQKETISSMIEYLSTEIIEIQARHAMLNKQDDKSSFPDEIEDFGYETHQEYQTIDIPGLMGDDAGLFFLWRHDRKSIRPVNSYVNHVLGQCSIWLTYATMPGLRSAEDKLRIRDELLSCKDRILSLIAQHLGIDKMLSGESIMDDWSDSDQGFDSLFELG
jgi:hypothetical protein